MKKIKSIFAFLMLSSLTLSGCAFLDFFKSKKNDTPADTGGGGEEGGGEHKEDKYTVSFNANGGTGSMSAASEVSGEYTLPECGFTAPEGKEFNGWKIGAEGEVKQPGEKITVEADITLIAQWKDGAGPVVVKYTVTFNVQGHGQAPQSVEVNEGGKVAKPTDPSAEGWTFGGWYKEEGCENAWDFETDTVSAATTLYAKWTENTPEPPAHEPPFIQHKSAEGDWVYTTLETDPEEGKDYQYKVAELDVKAGDEFVFCVAENDWRNFDKMVAEYSSASDILEDSGDDHNFKVTADAILDIYIMKEAGGSVYINLHSVTPEPSVDVHKLVINRVGEDKPIEVNLTLQSESTTEYKVEGQQLEVGDEFTMVVGTTEYKYADLKLGEGEEHAGGGVQDLFEEATDGSIKVKAAHKYNLFVETAESGKGIYTFASYFQYQEPEGEWLTPDVSLKVDAEHEDPITEYVIGQDEPIHLKAGTKFLFRIGEKWYKYADLKEGVTGISGDEDGNLVTSVAGNYTIYCDTVADGDGKFIWVACDADPVELNAKLIIGSSEIALDVKNTTEYYKEGVELTAGDEFIFEINDESYGYNLLKTSGVHQLFEEGSSDNKLKAKVSGEFDLYCETVESEDPMLRIHIQPSNDSLVYCNGAKTVWYMETLTHDEEEHQYPVTSKGLDKGARIYFCVGGVFTQTTENIEESSPAKSWFSDSETGLAVSVTGTYDLYYKESGSLYVDGTLDAARNYVEILRAATPTAPAEHETISLKVESAVTYYDEIYHQADLKAGDKIRFMVNGDWLDKISDSTAKTSFVDADENHYFEVKAGEDAVYNFYARFLGDDQGFWVVKYDAPVAVAHRFILKNSWAADPSAEFYAWVWGSGDPGHWELLTVEKDEL